MQLQTALATSYTLERELGRGGMATVFLAQDLRHDRPAGPVGEVGQIVAEEVEPLMLAEAGGEERLLLVRGEGARDDRRVPLAGQSVEAAADELAGGRQGVGQADEERDAGVGAPGQGPRALASPFDDAQGGGYAPGWGGRGHVARG